MRKKALISVWDKTNVVKIGKFWSENGYDLVSTGGTEHILKENNLPVPSQETITNSDENMDGKVKTLKPRIFGGI